MRPNGHGIRYLKSRTSKDGRTYYFWNPPKLTQGLKQFRWRTLGTDRADAFEQTKRLNRKLVQYREKLYGKPLRLSKIKPKTTAWLARAFEQSPKFRRYAKCTQEEYSRLYRKTEVFRVSGGNTYFGNLPFKKVTNQIAYGLYERYTDGTKKLRTAAQMVEAWAAAFNYARCNISGSVGNPFRQVEKHPLRPRIQRWSDDQLDSFVRTAHAMGEHSIAMCALMCMELMQRPGDILSLKWESLLHRDGFIRIVQGKRGAEVVIPPTQRLKDALLEAFNRTQAKSLEEIRGRYICPTKTGKRWQKRNLTGDARAIARLAGLPPDCDFQTVFVAAPDVKEALMPDENGKLQKSVIASLGVILDGKANLFRAECMVVSVPDHVDEAFLLDDMKTIATGNNLRNPLTWVEKSASGLVGRARGEIADSTTTYEVDIHRFVGKRNIFDVWVGSPPGTFPSEANLVFLKEIRLNGTRIY